MVSFGTSTYGMEASDVIETAMETPPRDNRVAKLLKEAEEAIAEKKIDKAKTMVEELEKTGVDQYDIKRLSSTIERFELLGI